MNKMSKRNFRRISQGIFLLLFLFLFIQTESKGNDTLGYPVKLFLDFDPLIFITTLFASHAGKIPAAFFLASITIFLTTILGRVFCGWMCPLGTLNNIVGSLGKRHSRKIPYQWHRAKYYILFFLIASSIFTLQLVGIVDPISLAIRSFSLSVYPLSNYGIRGVFDSIYQTNIPGVVDVSEFIYNLLKKFSLFSAAVLSAGNLRRFTVPFHPWTQPSRKEVLVQISLSSRRSSRPPFTVRVPEKRRKRRLHLMWYVRYRLSGRGVTSYKGGLGED